MADRSGFEEFVAYSSPRLARVAYLLTRDWPTAEDLVQTALTKAWFAWPRLHDDPSAYVRKILVNTYLSWWRRRWRGEVPTAELPDHPGTRDETRAVDDRDALWAALGRLPRRQRAVVVLRYFEDLSEVEVADLLGCSVGTVKSQASKALAKLRVDRSLAELAPVPVRS